ncbi:MAG: hypothetical protein IJ565_01125 [Bacilli bacterium]|nr:hypothetical protein [Bacilli bacterium]
MKKYLYDYIKEIDEVIEKGKVNKNIIDEHLIKIGFFQHERLIHLLVTLTYAILLISIIALSIKYQLLVIVVPIMSTFLICYVLHYFKLENGVQYLYKQYDKLKDFK